MSLRKTNALATSSTRPPAAVHLVALPLASAWLLIPSPALLRLDLRTDSGHDSGQDSGVAISGGELAAILTGVAICGEELVEISGEEFVAISGGEFVKILGRRRLRVRQLAVGEELLVLG